MDEVTRRDVVKLAAAGVAVVAGATAARGQNENKEAERMVTTYRIDLHNQTGKEVFLNIFGYEKNLSTQIARDGEVFKVFGSSYLPKGDYVYVARTILGDVVAYGKLTITKQVPIWFYAGADQHAFELRKK